MKIITRCAEQADLDILAEMNKQLIEDEGSRNPMSVNELHRRMTGWILNGWKVRIFENEENRTVIGYAMFCFRVDEYFPQQQEVYLRQLFIKREMRSQGIGELALKYLIEKEFPEGCKVVIDVLDTNPRGEAFWERMGFKPYYTNMQLISENEA